MGIDHEQAKDEVQRTFETLVMRDSLRAVVPVQVRFRSFLMACLNKTVVSSHRRDIAHKCGQGLVPEPLDGKAAQSVIGPAAATSPELALDRASARAVFERA
jgi:hypothetical protein